MILSPKLQALLQAIDPSEVTSPDTKLQKGERVVGVLSQPLIRLFALRKHTIEKVQLVVEQIKQLMAHDGVLGAASLAMTKKLHSGVEVTDAERNEYEALVMQHAGDLATEHDVLQTTSKSLNDIFWANVTLEFEIAASSSVGIGENWSVVVPEEADLDPRAAYAKAAGEINHAIGGRSLSGGSLLGSLLGMSILSSLFRH